MNYKTLLTPTFEKQVKRLSKKYPSLKKEVASLIEVLGNDPFQGTAIGNGCYKIRVSITSKGKGKSGGARVITHLRINNTSVYLLSICDKSEQTYITDKEIELLLKAIT